MDGKNTGEIRDSKLVICADGENLREIRLVDSIDIGRGSEKKNIKVQIEEPFLEEIQGKFLKEDTGFSYHDYSRGQITSVNGRLPEQEKLSCHKRYPLRDGDIIRIEPEKGSRFAGRAVVMFFRERYDEQEEWKKTSLEDKEMRLHISRYEEADGTEEVQTDLGELPKHYATLVHNKKGWSVLDHNTKFGVFVNNQKIDRECRLKNMDVIRIGNTAFFYWMEGLYYNHKETSGNKLVIHIEERSVWNLFRRKVLLEDIDLSILPGEMVLILGGSGAGKTTFMNAVMGYEKARGTIMEGDKDIYRDYNRMKYDIGFVPQQDLLRMEDSVYDTLKNAAQLKMLKNATEQEREERIDELLEMFGLDRDKKSMVGKLSGGQRKRLSIAQEFIAKPSLFFLDEPDSGLDGVMARFLMENLRKIADDDKIVLVITHAPDRAADLFDRVIVLAKSQQDNVGHLTFYGGVEEAKKFFEADSMEGIVKKINREDEGGEGLADFYIKKFEEIEKR